jgi:hypothetical protein
LTTIRPRLVAAVDTVGPLRAAASPPIGWRRRNAKAATAATAAAVATSARRGVLSLRELEPWVFCIVLLRWWKRSHTTMAFVRHVVLAATAQSRFRLTALERGVPAPIGAPMSVDIAADGDRGAENGESDRLRDEDESARRRT